MIVGTYRLQLNRDFNFESVMQHLDYFQELGVSHLYLSPVLMARPSSTHGYDVVDHTRISDELGGEEQYRELIQEAKRRSLGIIQDIVPNHMAIHHENWRLMDLLEKGKESKYYDYFDHYDDRLILPFLEDDLDKVISQGKIKISRDWVEYGGLKFPINEEGKRYLESLNCPDGSCLDQEEIKRVLSLQHYILVPWRESPNYRRFFAVNDLIAVRVELDHVFEESHSFILEFPVDGFRIDHVDGLYDPAEYLRKVRQRVGKRLIYVEKILQLEERLPAWDVEGTTGYDFMNYVNLLLVSNPNDMIRIYESFIGKKVDVKGVISESKRLVANTLFKSDLERLSHLLGVDLDYLVDFLVCLKVYRTYTGEEGEIGECDKENRIPKDRLKRLQQYMPAIFAKGYEDTALFRYNALIYLNEVGSDISISSISLEKFHEFNMRRKDSLSLNATSTHDSKFSEDVRARISVLSEIPRVWEARVRYWHDLLKPRIDRNDEYRIYQTFVGSYEETQEYGERLRNHVIKALREAKVHTMWENPNLEYEERAISLVNEMLHNRSFLEDFRDFMKIMEKPAYKKSLVTLALKILSPGVPDIYQGAEVWRFLLTDPDNRMPVNFERLRQVMNQLPEKLELEVSDEKVKMWFTRNLLRLKRLGLGEYVPLRHGFSRGNAVLLFSTRTMEVPREKVDLKENYVNLVSGEKMRIVDLGELEKYGIIVLVREGLIDAVS